MLNKNKKSNNSNNSFNLHNNIDDVKIKASMLENMAKMKEKQLKLTGGAGNNPELGEQVSELYLDVLKAKLSILNSLQEDDKNIEN